MNKISKRVILIILSSVFIVALALLGNTIISNSNIKMTEETEIQVDPRTREKSNNALIEDVVRNFRSIYVSLVNDKELDFSFLNNVINKDSDIYGKVVDDIKSKRDKNTKFEDESFDIKDIKEATDGYEVFTSLTYTETVGGSSKIKTLEQSFKILAKDSKIIIIGIN